MTRNNLEDRQRATGDIKKQVHTLRACITSFRMQEEDIVFLVKALNKTMKGW